MFSWWQTAKLPTADDSRHWAGAPKRMLGTIKIDGLPRRYFGRGGDSPLHCTDTVVTPLSSVYVYEDLGIRLTLRFTSPLLSDDLDILSTPISFVDYKLEFTDGKKHNVSVNLNFSEDTVYAGENTPRMRRDLFADGELKLGYMGQMQQKPLSGSGDHLTQDWGYLFLGTKDGNITFSTEKSAITLDFVKVCEEPCSFSLLVGYDDIASINYFGQLLPAYYARNGKTITQAMQEFSQQHDALLSRCEAFDAKLLADAEKIGGRDYALIVTAAYRQSVAAHKLVADKNGDLLFISKENDSNGCAATVDVSYPSVPLYLLYCPELVRAMCRPVLKFSRMPIWHYDFAPHDVGRYPVLNGQIYAAYLRNQNHSEGNTIAPYYLYPASVDAYNFKKQMPVEESANMILMLASAAFADGKFGLIKENLDLLEKWNQYLLQYGEDPGEQLCTDDFAGHLAHNVNLSAKAIMGVAAYSWILNKIGQTEKAAELRQKAHAMGDSWLARADAGGYTYLTFEKTGWSQKYNLVWDKLMKFGILPDEFYRKEIASYLPRLNAYGLPLDSRCEYTKSDWTMWVAAMADDKKSRMALMKPLAKFLRESESHVPFSDFYNTETGYYERFIARSVQGGVFMPLLMKAWSRRKG